MRRLLGSTVVLSLLLVAACESAEEEAEVPEVAVTGERVQILSTYNGRYTKHGWNHYGPGYFELDSETGVLTARGGMGLLWYGVKEVGNFILELEYMCADEQTNSGVFLRVPGVPSSNDYIYHSWEIQISHPGEGVHRNGAVYDAEAPSEPAGNPPGEWNSMKITFQGNRIGVEVNGTAVIDWEAEPRGKIEDFADSGYIGLQNHDDRSPVYFRNIFLTELP